MIVLCNFLTAENRENGLPCNCNDVTLNNDMGTL